MGLSRNIGATANIEVHIEELVLEGFDPRHRYHIAAAVERELARLFAQQGMGLPSAEPLALARLDAGAFNVLPGATPAAIGAQLAQAIHGGLRQ